MKRFHKLFSEFLKNIFKPKKPLFTIGGARRDRTDDLLRARQTLSQLSYGPINLNGGSGWT